MAETLSVLFFHVMRYKLSSPRDSSSDRFILSKGHAAPILYAGETRPFMCEHFLLWHVVTVYRETLTVLITCLESFSHI
jgi:transketolase N-terminal domain/subunit